MITFPEHEHDPKDPDMIWLAERGTALIRSAVADDTDGITAAITQTGRRFGNPGIFTLCAMMAAAIQTAVLPGVELGKAPPGALNIEMTQEPDEADRWAFRFVAAFFVGDKVAAAVIFDEAKGFDDLITNVVALINMAGWTVREDLDRRGIAY